MLTRAVMLNSTGESGTDTHRLGCRAVAALLLSVAVDPQPC